MAHWSSPGAGPSNPGNLSGSLSCDPAEELRYEAFHLSCCSQGAEANPREPIALSRTTGLI